MDFYNKLDCSEMVHLINDYLDYFEDAAPALIIKEQMMQISPDDPAAVRQVYDQIAGTL